MTRRKQDRFRQNAQSENVIEAGKPLYQSIRGRWHSDYFHNPNPISVELACGQGEYTVGLAQVFPGKNFIGVDIKGDRIAHGARAAQALSLSNVAFLRTDINFLDEFFADREISEIWITFPDPQPRRRQDKHRLTHPRFLRVYERLLTDSGTLHLKTDSAELFAYSVEQLGQSGFHDLQWTTDLYTSPYNVMHQELKRFTNNCLQIKDLQ